jgi:type II secretory pathway predicted ATPase ExeA
LVVLCDDLHLATPAVQQWFARLWDVHPAGRLPITVVAAMHEEECHKLASSFAERVDLCIDVEPWQLEDLQNFVSCLADAPATEIIEVDAMQRLLALSGGNPRQIRKLVRMSLLACLGCDEDTVQEATLLSVSEELCGFPWDMRSQTLSYPAVYA